MARLPRIRILPVQSNEHWIQEHGPHVWMTNEETVSLTLRELPYAQRGPHDSAPSAPNHGPSARETLADNGFPAGLYRAAARKKREQSHCKQADLLHVE